MISNGGTPTACFGQYVAFPVIAADVPPASDRLTDTSVAAPQSCPSAGVPTKLMSVLAPALLCLGLAAPAEALTIDVTYDSSVTSLGNSGSVTTADIENAYNAVATAFDSAITNNVTVAIGVGWGEANGTSVPAGDVSTSRDAIYGSYSYSAITGLLAGTGATLPASNPAVTSNGYYIPDAEAKALGINVTPSWSINGLCHCDGYIGFNTAANFSFNPAATPAGPYDFTAAAEHETEEVLGRTSGLTSSSPVYATPFDIYRYSAAGINSFSYTATAYASTDGGVTDLGTYNSSANGGDRGDWAVPNPQTNTDAQDAFAATGVVAGLSLSDQDLLEGLGWTFASDPGPLFSGADAPIGAAVSLGDPINTPEPASLPLFLLGIGAIPLIRRLRLS